MTVWKAPNVAVPVAGMVRMICDSMPGAALDLSAERTRARTLPIISKPDFVEAGLYGNLALMNALVERWRKEDGRP